MPKIIPLDKIREKYFFTNILPTPWCKGCGLGSLGNAMLQAFERLGLDQKKTALISGIGCNGYLTRYLKFDDLHALHGRTPAMATGLKMARPDLKVITIQGDGDAAAIGGNHLIHAARRNIGITAIVSNNFTYGRTGGQYGPTSSKGSYSTTSPYGLEEPPFDLCSLMVAAGANFVARGTSYHVVQLTDLMEKAMGHKGYSFIEVVTQCPTNYGRRNPADGVTGPAMLRWQKENAISVEEAAGMSEEALRGKVVTGVFVDRDRPEYNEQYDAIRQRAQGKGGRA
jgi:2-oxoglutarate/2-oxoacid ferredoxin oxidoreductase subunit beta